MGGLSHHPATPVPRSIHLCLAAALTFTLTPVIAQDDTGSGGVSGGEGSGAAEDANSEPSTANSLAPSLDAWGNLVVTTKPITVVAGTSISNDDNLFKQTTPSSDTVQSTSLGLRINKPYSLQTFQFNFNKTYTRYSHFSYLNNSGMDYRGAWLWSLTPRITGTLSRDYRHSLVPFQETTGSTARNIRVGENNVVNLDAWVTGGWHLTGSLSRNEQRSQQSVTASPDTFTTTRELGAKFIALSGNSAAATQRGTSGGYINATGTVSVTANGFRRQESELRVSWRLTGKSIVNGRVAWFQHKQLGASQYDVAGPVGDISYLWTPTGMLQVVVTARDTLTPTPDPVYTKITNKGISLAPAWQISAKTKLRVTLDSSRFEYGGSSGITPLIGPPRVDSLQSATLGMDWLTSTTITLSASLQRQQRRSNTSPLTEFNDTVANFNASLTF